MGSGRAFRRCGCLYRERVNGRTYASGTLDGCWADALNAISLPVRVGQDERPPALPWRYSPAHLPLRVTELIRHSNNSSPYLLFYIMSLGRLAAWWCALNATAGSGPAVSFRRCGRDQAGAAIAPRRTRHALRRRHSVCHGTCSLPVAGVTTRSGMDDVASPRWELFQSLQHGRNIICRLGGVGRVRASGLWSRVDRCSSMPSVARWATCGWCRPSTDLFASY